MMVLSGIKSLLRKGGSGYRMLMGRDPSTVREFLAAHYLKGEGLEVGALDKPMPVAQGIRVRYVDRLDREDLLRQYPELAGRRLVHIDVVTDGENLKGVGDASQDFVIASHFLEHCEDPIGTLKNFLRVTRPGGILFLALPDKRFTFDRDRSETSYEHLLRDHREGPEPSRREHFEEWVGRVDGKSGSEAVSETERLMAIRYSIHFHVFTGGSMLEILGRLAREEGLNFGVEAFLQNGDEFLCVLRK